jgi:tetratricopeptide (TPR) repeat protein
VYRGQSNGEWKVISGLYRRIQESKKNAKLKQLNVSHQDVIEYLREKIVEAKKRISVHQQSEIQEMNDINLLVEMQHYGGATNLIDFSFNSLIALYFACFGNQDVDGKVFCINYINQHKVLSVPSNKINSEDLLSHLFPSPPGQFYAYSPNHSNPRIIKQDSIFIFNDVGYIEDNLIDHVFIIKANCKANIMQDLRDFSGITEESIYPDFLGYLQANNHRIPFKIKNAQDYFEQGVLAQKNKNYNHAIEYYKKSIELDPEQAKPYLEIARCFRQLEKFKDALKNCLDSLTISSDAFMAWNELGIIQTYLHDYTEAKSAFIKAEDLVKNEHQKIILTNNRGWMYICFSEHEQAKEILLPLMKEEKPFHQAINLGHCYLFSNNEGEAINCYIIAFKNARNENEFWKSLESDYRLVPMSKFGVTKEIFEKIREKIVAQTISNVDFI